MYGIPVSLYNTWHKLVRYKHHGYFLVRCTKRSRIPKGLKLPFKLQLDKDNGSLQESCRQHSLSASLNILKDISTAVWSKTKILPRQLHFERELLFNNNEETAAKTIWRRIKRQMEKVEIDLKRRARQKFRQATPYNPAPSDQFTPPENSPIVISIYLFRVRTHHIVCVQSPMGWLFELNAIVLQTNF